MTTNPQEVIESILKDFPAHEFENFDAPSPEPVVEPEPTLESTEAPEPTPAPEFEPAPETEPTEALIEPPGGPIWRDDPTPSPEPGEPATTPTVTLSDGSILPLAVVEDLYRSRLTPQATTGLLPPPADQPPTPGPALQLPAFSDDDLDNPALRAVVMIAAEQQRQLQAISQQQQEQEALVKRQNMAASANIINTAVANFRTTYNLPEDLMQKVGNTAANELDIKLQIAYQRDPDNFNAYQVVTDTLRTAYWDTPDAREFEFNRQMSQREKAETRKRNLNAIGGSGGAAPRRQPAPEGSLHDQLIAEAAQHMGVNE